VLVVGEDVAGFEDLGDLVLGTAAPGLGQDDDRDERPDVRTGQFVVQGEEVRVAPFGGEQRARVVDDGGALPGGSLGLVVDQPGLAVWIAQMQPGHTARRTAFGASTRVTSLRLALPR
jgi:hypothetical protein